MAALGLIAGGGDLPREILRACQAADRPIFVVRLRGCADPDLGGAQAVDSGVAEWGRTFKALREHDCDSVCFAGLLPRPDFATLRPDLRGLAALPGVIAAATHGDDALLRHIAAEFEREGFRIEGAHQVVASLSLGEGALGRHQPGEAHQLDIVRAMAAARALGRLDIGQAAVAARGLILAVEAQEGTDALLRRCAELPAALRGSVEAPVGVLAKAPKPNQDRRIDLPTIGVATLVAAARAGLAGVVGEAGGLLIVDRPKAIETADELGLFIFGLTPIQPEEPAA